MMRITNNMMMTNTKSNINNNKVSVDKLNTKMSTQKKLTKPSDNALIAIRSLRLNDTLSSINQFYKNNIPDAESWMDVTETALRNMETIVRDAYKLAVNGATDTLTEDDRNTILTQLQSLSSQLYHEANSDYAGRTVFTGYKTNETVTFNNDYEASQAKYEIEEKLDYSKIEETKYYANAKNGGVPTSQMVSDAVNAAGGVNTAIAAYSSPEEVIQNRIRLGYKSQTQMNNVDFSFAVETTSSQNDGTVEANLKVQTAVQSMGTDRKDVNTQTVEWRSANLGTTFTYQSDKQGNLDYAKLSDSRDNEIYFKIADPANPLSVGDSSYRTVSVPATPTAGSVYLEFSYDASALNSTTKNNGTTRIFTNTDGEEVYRIVANTDGSFTLRDSSGNKMTVDSTGKEIVDVQGNTITSGTNQIKIDNEDGKNLVQMDFSTTPVSYTTAAGTGTAPAYFVNVKTNDKASPITTALEVETMTAAEFESYLSKVASKAPATAAGYDTLGEQTAAEYTNKLIYLSDSGEVVLGSNLTQNITSEKAGFTFDYDKNGFESTEVRPEMYYNCINKTDAANPIQYVNYDAEDGWVYQNIDYQVSANQTLNVNTQIANVVNSDTYRDLEEMTNAIQLCIEAHNAVKSIEDMLDSPVYADDDSQAYLKKALTNAEKQASYYDDYIHTTYSKQITRFENYLSDINLAITDSGARGERLALTKNRMSNQQTTFKELQSENDDEELSDITIDYTTAYQAYQASLQAAGKIGDMSLLDYI